ncbi:MAG: GNAT family N-acetyltransferase [bacterium]
MRASCSVHTAELIEMEVDYSSEFISAPIPDSLWCEVERLYNSVFSSKVMLVSVDNDAETLHAWVEKTLQQISTILLFQKKGCVIYVANEVIEISSEVIKRFSKIIFSKFSDIHCIRFHAVILEQPLKDSLLRTSIFSEDYVLKLPTTKEQWIASLSARAREKLRSYLRRALNEKNGIQFIALKNTEIDEKDVRSVIRLNQLRMIKKRKNYGMTVAEEGQLCEQIKKGGLLFLLKKDNVICAGFICTALGTDVFMHVLAHDPAFDKLRLGLVCCSKTIEHLISLNYQHLHFLWGHYDYKKQMGAKPVDLSRVLVIKGIGYELLHPIIMGLWYVTKARDQLRKLRHKRASKI